VDVIADIFDLIDLPSWLQIPQVDTETAIRVRRYANGWLMSATGLSSWPAVIPDDLWAWAIELAGIAYRNPTGLTSETVDGYSMGADSARKAEILAAAKARYSGAGSPQYSFPAWDWTWTSVEPTNSLTN
jgi:hypothetical protein